MWISNYHRRIGSLFVAMAMMILLPRLFQLDRFVTPDELLWVARSANFYSGLRNGNLEATYQREHPGVTVMWSGALAFLLKDPAYGQGGFEQVNWEELQSLLEENASIKAQDLLVTARLVVVLVITATLSLSFYLARRLVGLLPAVISFLLIAFDPFPIGLSRLLHLDALLAGFMFLSLLAYLSYLQEKKTLFLVISGIAAGLACLTKSPGVLLIPVIGLLALTDLKKTTVDQKAKPAGSARSFLSTLAVWGLILVAVAVLLWPALWQKPAFVLSSIFANTQVHILEGHPTPAFFNGKIYPDGDINDLSFYAWSFLWRTTPVILVGLILSALAFISRRKPFDEHSSRLTAFGCLLFTLLFGAVMTLGAKKFDRYLLPVTLPLSLLSGMGWAALVYIIRGQFSKPLARYALPALLLAIAGYQVYAAINTFPYYLTYYNPLLGGSGRAPRAMLIGWGEGLDEAGRYLSQKPNPKQLRVLSWLPYGSLSYYFPGKVRPILSDEAFSQVDLARLDTTDYVVIYAQQWQLDFPQPLLDYLSHSEPEHTIWIDGIEYARIYKLR